MLAQLANESFGAGHVRFRNIVGAVVDMPMRSDLPAANAFLRDHLRVSLAGKKFRQPSSIRADMIGSTRSRVSFFMNKFRELGFVDYNGGQIEVHSSLLNLVLHEKPEIRS